MDVSLLGPCGGPCGVDVGKDYEEETICKLTWQLLTV